MAKNIDQVKNKLKDALATNINNILTTTNNTNNTNNLTTITFVKNKDGRDNELCSSLGLASLSATQDISGSLSSPRDSINFVGGSELPRSWLNFKWDLFKNPSPKTVDQLRINLNIVRQDGTQAKLTASLNSPHDRIWRNVDEQAQASDHWQLIRSEYSDWRKTYGPKLTDWRASKFYLPGKKESGETVVFLREETNEYQLRLFYRATLLDYTIPKNSYDILSIKQIQGNQIATLFVGQKTRKLATADDWGI